jgi:membrane protein
MSWVVVLAGATLAAMLPAYRYAEGPPIPGRDFADARAVLSVLARTQNRGGAVRLRQISDAVRLMPHRCEAVLERAARLGWTARTEKDSWVLARDADTLRVADLYRVFAFDAETWGTKDGDFGRTLREYATEEKKA